MAEKRVSVRLAAVGGKQVKAEFEGIGEAGKRGFGKVSREAEIANAKLARFARRAKIAAGIMAAAEGVRTRLETVQEIITKKVVYRGKSIKVRDIFDIAAAARDHEEAVIKALAGYPEAVENAISAMEKLSPDFVAAYMDDLDIRQEFAGLRSTAVDLALNVLRDAKPN